MKEITLALRDLNPDLERVYERHEVPDVPTDVLKRIDSNGDVVFDREEQRWRFRQGELIGYIEYGGSPRRPVAMYGGNY